GLGQLSTLAMIRVNRAFLYGDHWQGGYGWIGPMPQGNDPGFAETVREIRRAFTSRNAIGEVVSRHMSGVVGREPRWGLSLKRALKQDEAPSDAEQALIDEAEALLTTWWDRRKVHQWLQRFVTTLAYAGPSALRLYVPDGLLDDKVDATTKAVTRAVTASSVEEGLSKLWLDHPLPEQCTVAVDEDTQQIAGVLLYETGKKTTGQGSPERRAEITYADGDQTVVRILDGANSTEYRLDFGGHLTIFEARRSPIITPQVQESQRALNLALSMLPRNVVTGGFLERVLLNAQMPGEWVTDQTTGQKRFYPEPYYTGAGTTNFVQGVQYDQDGKTVLANPSVHYRDPVPVTASIEAKRSHYEDILEETKQAHVLMNQDARASGKSREQARADFESDLTRTKTFSEAAGRWIITTALAMAEAFAGTPGLYTNQLRATFACQIDTGPLTAQERTANDASVGKTLSRETAMERNGIVDVDAELQRMNAEPSAQIALVTAQATAIKTLTDAGAGLVAAAVVADLSEEDVVELEKPATFTQPVTQ
ncbi:MAG: hypothetical protein ACR2KM_04120, partial [Gemmatimonadaceae bacterium]